MKMMKIFLIVFAITALNFMSADRYLIPKTPIPADEIIIKEKIDSIPQRVILESKVYLDENQKFIIALDNQTKFSAVSNGLKEIPSYKAVEMPNGSYELTDLSMLLQYEDISSVETIVFDYGLDMIELMPAINILIFKSKDMTQLNDLITSLNSDARVVDVSFNLIEMSEVPE
tara:strand:- start:52 stop:570 length:519 start_codon:yes stop_codon:yes gene_type:complete